MSFHRYAIYYVPTDGALASFGAAWLGWDVARATEVVQVAVPGISDVTSAPGRYGLHATLKPPFRLAEGKAFADLQSAIAPLAASCPPARCDGIELSRMGRFLALTPVGDASDLSRVARLCVADLDAFRAPPTDAELARRRQARLSDRQDEMLLRWGYPYVMEEFRFHMTLTGRLPKADIPRWTDAIEIRLPPLPNPFVLDQIALVGERPDGRFELISRHSLGAPHKDP